MIGEEDIAVKSVESGEIRIKDPITGAEKGQKIERFGLIPAVFLLALATHYGRGAKKYKDRNWEGGYSWQLSYDAAQRHTNAWLRHEDYDHETGTHHLICAIWHLIALYCFQLWNRGTDDLRPKY